MERPHLCMFDNISIHISEFSKHILMLENNVKDDRLILVSKNPELCNLFHDSEDFVKALEWIPNRAACGPDGWIVHLVKDLKPLEGSVQETHPVVFLTFLITLSR